MDWLRWHHGTSTDPKWRLIAVKCKVPVSLVLAIWSTMLENASANNAERGTLDGWEADEQAAALDANAENVREVFDAMQGRVLDGIRLTGWQKRQPQREDGSAERSKAWREKQKEEKDANAAERKRTLDKRREEKKKREREGAGERIAFGEFGRALLTQDQHGKLKKKLGSYLDDFISQFDTWVQQAPDAKHNGVKRCERDPYASIGSWFDRAVKDGKVKPKQDARTQSVHSYL